MTTLTFTTQDQEAIDFFSEMSNQVQYFGLTVLADREERLLFKKGRKLVEAALNYNPSVRVPLTEEEILPIFNEYLRSYDENGQVKVFDRKVAAEGVDPSRKDKIATAMAIHGQIVFYDRFNNSIVKSFDRTGKTLKGILQAYNESTQTDRFSV